VASEHSICFYRVASCVLSPSLPLNRCQASRCDGTLYLFAHVYPVHHHPNSVFDDSESEVVGALFRIALGHHSSQVRRFSSAGYRRSLLMSSKHGCKWVPPRAGHGLGHSPRYVVVQGTQMHAEYVESVFWPGFMPTFVRAVPVNMATFCKFEGALSKM
jgi:hypothetical protein